MKKTLVVLMAVVLGLSVPASALPPVTIDDGQATQMIAGYSDLLILFGMLKAKGLTADLEGGGIPTVYQLALLGAALDDADVADGFAANKIQYTGFANAVVSMLEWAGADQSKAAAANDALGPFLADPANVAVLEVVINANVPDPQLAAALFIMLTDEALCELLDLDYIPDLMPELVQVLGEMGDAAFLTGITLNVCADTFTGVLSISQDMQDAVIAGLTAEKSRLYEFAEHAELLTQVAMVFQLLAGTAVNLPGGPDLVSANAFNEFVGSLTTGVSKLNAIAIPQVPILGVVGGGKALDEPFSALGDYSGDGSSNLFVYTAINGAGGGVGDFIAAASGANPFYPGNPNLPAAGLIGLVALVGAFAAGGAFVLRRK